MQNWRRHSIFWPLLLIAAGVLLFLNNTGGFPGTTWDTVLRLWPLVLIIAGLDGFWRGEGYAGATVVTGLGVLLLLGNLGYLTLSAWEAILRLWPVLLVGIGLDLLIGRQRPWSALIGLLLGLAVTVGIFWLVVSSALTTQFRSEQVTFTLDQAQTVDGMISLPVGRLNLSGGAEGNQMLFANLKVNTGEDTKRSQSAIGSSATFLLEGRGFASFVPFTNMGGLEEWNVQLNPAPAYDLKTRLAVGEAELNLSGLKVSEIQAQAAVGKTTLTLPAQGPLNGKIETAIGETVIYVPRGTPARIRVSGALITTSQPADFTSGAGVLLSPGFNADGGIDLTVSQAIGVIRVLYLP